MGGIQSTYSLSPDMDAVGATLQIRQPVQGRQDIGDPLPEDRFAGKKIPEVTWKINQLSELPDLVRRIGAEPATSEPKILQEAEAEPI